jgi:UDP-glucose 4-epimerase
VIVAITGAGGFIGHHLTEHLRTSGVSVREINLRANGWEDTLRGATVLVHLAGSAHFSQRRRSDIDLLQHDDVLLAHRVIAAAVSSGLQHVVHVSSIKARGLHDSSLPPRSEALPADAYGQLKRAVEVAVKQKAEESGLPVWIARFPLVYGPRVRANFLLLLNAVSRGFPLPLGHATAPRSYIGVRNLCSALTRCIEQTPNANFTIYPADLEPLSTCELVRLMRDLFESNTILLPVPKWIMKVSLQVVGKGEMYSRLFEELTVDSANTKDVLNWQPPFMTREELEWTIQWHSDSYSL